MKGCGYMMGSGVIKIAVLLIALAFGYIVCYLADREEKDLRKVGYIIGVFIMGLSAFLILWIILLHIKSFTMGMCPLIRY